MKIVEKDSNGKSKRDTWMAEKKSGELADYVMGESEADLASVDDFSSEESSGDIESGSVEERDEVREVERVAAKDTRRLHVSRAVVTLVLLLTALAVTLTTYFSLKKEEDTNFETAVSICS